MKHEQLAVYFIMGTQNVKNRQALEVLEEALQAGVTIFQFREKGDGALKGPDYEQFARECQALCKTYQVPFIVNDDVDLAVALQADGVHIGQDDEKARKVREKIGKGILGISAHSLEEVKEAVRHGADYVGIGPVFPTKSKADAKSPVGTELLEQVVANFPDLPAVAIGGITEERASAVLQTGIGGVAVISAICESPYIQATVKQLKR
ncbi:thiamine-phosphate pyrophosphorylase [Lysinibacillus odysseyi 34hs-1 = NBRC 100172]|uniref:Thiamine-phosphate synthase n=2 Tax=Lysinibacillus odysseyi TaxID=202611 RepID=A0A0A3IF28_9BACI|nr:thiamine-phosphate pyrophosphorylase [Lysinibacillus odysseyi 34hs-1 = NBRC 100172]